MFNLISGEVIIMILFHYKINWLNSFSFDDYFSFFKFLTCLFYYCEKYCISDKNFVLFQGAVEKMWNKNSDILTNIYYV